MRAKRALMSAYYVPEPDRDSGSRQLLHLMEFLQEAGWHVTFVATNGLGNKLSAQALQQRGVALFDGSRTPMTEVLAWGQFDLAVFGFWPVAELHLPTIRRVSPATRVLVASIDLHFLRDSRRIFRQTEAEVTRLLDDDFGSQFTGELNTYAAADAVLTVSQKEANLVNEFIGDPLLAHPVPDCEALDPSPLPYSKRRGIVLLGNYNHPPNVQAVEYFCREILPLVGQKTLARHPVSVIGTGLDETVRSFGRNLRHVKMIGWVPSVEPYLQAAQISVLPLRYGAGTKRKLVQTLMVRTPAVATSIAAEGLNLNDEEHVLIADAPSAFAAAMKSLVADQRLWERLARRGQDHVRARHGRDVARLRFLDVVDGVLSVPPKPAILPAVTEDQYGKRVSYQYHQQLMPRIRRLVQGVVPRDATVAVVTTGSTELLRIDAKRVWHFPQNDDGTADPKHPRDAAHAIGQLDALRQKGANFLILPAPSLWWLGHYAGLKEYLDRDCVPKARSDDACAIYEMPRASAEPVAKASDGARGSTDAGTKLNLDRGVIDDGSETGAELSDGSSEAANVKLIAFYLPQFHSIPENDSWWGEGFTEWTNVIKAQPLFSGHAQPRVPADLGFCDLRLAETRQAQADLARQFGIHGFCYYHYWFDGRRLLERPFDEVLGSGRPDFPFCLCWANEPWSRRWNGSADDVLQPQTYSEADDRAHIESLLPALQDPRAIRVDGKPVFLVYHALDLPDPARTVATWREVTDRTDLDGLYLIAVETGWDLGWDAREAGFDAKVLFQPLFSTLRSVPSVAISGKPDLKVYEYGRAWPVLAGREPVLYRRYDCVFPAWDNTPRAGERGIVLHDSTPRAYEGWLRKTVEKALAHPPGQQLVFLNAWNEWAEGCYLEPDCSTGLAYLEATRRALHLMPQMPPKRTRAAVPGSRSGTSRRSVLTPQRTAPANRKRARTNKGV